MVSLPRVAARVTFAFRNYNRSCDFSSDLIYCACVVRGLEKKIKSYT